MASASRIGPSMIAPTAPRPRAASVKSSPQTAAMTSGSVDVDRDIARLQQLDGLHLAHVRLARHRIARDDRDGERASREAIAGAQRPDGRPDDLIPQPEAVERIRGQSARKDPQAREIDSDALMRAAPGTRLP